MPYTRAAAAYIASLENHMAYFHVSDPAIKDRVVSKFGWASYAEYVAAAAKHSGTRTLEATEIQAQQ